MNEINRYMGYCFSFPPTREFSNEQWTTAFNASEMNTIVLIQLKGVYVKNTYTRPISRTTGTVTRESIDDI